MHPVHLLAGTLGSSKHVGVEVGMYVCDKGESQLTVWDLFWKQNFRVEDFLVPPEKDLAQTRAPPQISSESELNVGFHSLAA